MATAIFERTEKPLYRVYDGERLVVKRCGRCGEHKRVEAFHKDASRKDGYMVRCRDCEGIEGPRKDAEHGSEAMYKKGCRCEPCRAKHSETCREYRKRQAKKYTKPLASCSDCGETLSARNRTGVCRPCQNVRHGKRKRSLARRAALIRQQELSAQGTSGTRLWAAGICPECGQSFVKPTTGVYCATKCRRRARHHIRRVIARSPDSIEGSWQVYNRDNYICWLCNEKCDPTAHYLDPNYPTLDHVIPVSLGGGHTMDNLRTAHRHCNSTRTGPGQGR